MFAWLWYTLSSHLIWMYHHRKNIINGMHVKINEKEVTILLSFVVIFSKLLVNSSEIWIQFYLWNLFYDVNSLQFFTTCKSTTLGKYQLNTSYLLRLKNINQIQFYKNTKKSYICELRRNLLMIFLVNFACFPFIMVE